MLTQAFHKSFFLAAACALLSSAVPSANAQCTASLKNFKPTALLSAPSRAAGVHAAVDPNELFHEWPSIVGMWHVTFTARTMNGSLIPETVIDNALVVWHDDKTEIMNSGRPPQDGNFCLGVWEETAPRTYQLNHFAWAGNGYAPGTPDGTVGQPIGPVHYRELVTLGPAGKHYSGSFTLQQYDTAGKVAVSFTGVLNATRITVNSTVDDLK